MDIAIETNLILPECVLLFVKGMHVLLKIRDNGFPNWYDITQILNACIVSRSGTRKAAHGFES